MSHAPRPIKEERVKNRVKKLLTKYGASYFMPVQSGYGSTSLDFLACHKGRFLAVETKAPGKHLTNRQELIKDTIEAAGGRVFVIGELFIPGDHVGYASGKVSMKDTFSGLEALEGWLLLGP